MPWRSKAQQRWGHSAAGLRALGGKKAVHEWDSVTNFKRLPAKTGKHLPDKSSTMQRETVRRGSLRAAAQKLKSITLKNGQKPSRDYRGKKVNRDGTITYT